VAGLLDLPDEGEVRLDGQSVSNLPEKARCDLRLRRLGFVFQAFNLVPVLSALENVMLLSNFRAWPMTRPSAGPEPLWIAWASRTAPTTAPTSSAAVSSSAPPSPAPWPRTPCWSSRMSPPPASTMPTAGPSWNLMAELARERGVTFLVASHDPAVISRAHRIFRLMDGQLIGEERP